MVLRCRRHNSAVVNFIVFIDLFASLQTKVENQVL